MAEKKTPARGADFIASLVKDPKAPPDVLMLTGYLGASSEDAHTRLYLDPHLGSYVEIPDAAILHRQPVEQDALGASHVWIERDAQLTYGPARAPRAKGTFLEGPIMQAHMAGALAAAAAAPPVTPACPQPGPLTLIGCPSHAIACPTHQFVICHSLDPVCPATVGFGCPVSANVKGCTFVCTPACPTHQGCTPACPTHQPAFCPTHNVHLCPPTPFVKCLCVHTAPPTCVVPSQGCPTEVKGCTVVFCPTNPALCHPPSGTAGIC
jgi:hypothetical protein